VRESELRLQKEIKEVEGRLLKKIEVVRKEIKELEGRLRKEIEHIRLETKALEVRLTRAIHRYCRGILLYRDCALICSNERPRFLTACL